ncbi:hypothetical protein [Hyunsoonleella pacifica]|uniref:Fibronectin type-III domain-containing protein n=1 Tax=Hyunsoonleella pacifica TaxID=1080224 RepID=A0A4Q9FLW0_9FLAO|nr:hypothetical protein [Hyunsoonleella pacifica]TBN13838.1 hypothetical protein EYD46_15195 [Hyunsoonleella pacifica]GGD26120.1 hypothetical protein GCM10011368_30140 [Hyunsoonleella pacifica]
MKKIIYVICFSFLVFACSNPSTIEPDPISVDPEEPSEIDKLTVSLQFPHKDELCNTGANITPTQSTVFFEWEASDVADGYRIFVTNLIDGSTIEEETTEDKIGIVINRATPYSWYVQSKRGTITAESETWKFYNSGPGVETYAPFPATINAPDMAASVNAGTVTLIWSGSDVDDDIVNYDVYLGTSNTPDIHASAVTATQLDVTVSSGAIYHWKIVTRDATGNTSESSLFQFRVL